MKGKTLQIKLYILALLLIPYKEGLGEVTKTSLKGYEVISEIQTEEIPVLDESSALDENQIFLKHGVIYSTTDPLNISPKLNISSREEAYINSVGSLEEIKFFTYTNYRNFIDRYEVLVYGSNDPMFLKPLKVLRGEKLPEDGAIIWKDGFEKGTQLKAGDFLYYVLKVYDKKGNFDETVPRKIFLQGTAAKKLEKDDTDIKEDIYGQSNLKVNNILVSGAAVRFYGRNLYDTKSVSVNGQEVELDDESNFVYETLSNIQDEKYEFEIASESGEVQKYPMVVSYPENYQFLVGIADFYLGKNNVKGSTAILENDPDYQDDLFNTGRLAFYYKKIYDNKYRITAHADTWSKEIKHMFSDFNEKDPQKVFRKIDRDDIKFNNGDDSYLYSDVETEGKMYLRVEWDKSQVLWGSYNTGFTGTKYGEYNRSLYGARAEYNSVETNKFGNSITHAAAFGSNPDTSYNRDTFLGTGGSIYYLSKSDLVVGSAKLTVELRDNQTGRLLDKVELTEGQDYEINELTGRVLLERPLSQGSLNLVSDEIIKDNPSGSYKYFLVADYEYYSLDYDISERTAGFRGKQWLNDNIAVGATYVEEKRNSNIDDYDLKGVDFTYKYSNGTYFLGEFSQSNGNQLTKDSNWFSPDGGFDFIEQPLIKSGDKGNAYYLETGFQFSDYSENFSDYDGLRAWYSKKDKGFSTASDTSGTENQEYGAEIRYQQNETLRYALKGSVYTEESYDDEEGVFSGKNSQKEISATATKDLDERLTVGLEVKYVKDEEKDETLATIEQEDIDSGEAVLVGTKISYDLTENTEIYTKLQGTAMKREGYGANNSVSLGGTSRVTENLTLEAEGTAGSRGQAVDSRLSYKYSENYEMYLGYLFENEDSLNSAVTVGQKYQVSDRTSLYQENQFVNKDSERGLLQTYGVDYQYSKKLELSLLYENGKVKVNEGDVTRNSISALAKYRDKEFSSKHRLEFAKDTGDQDRKLYGTTNRFKWTPGDEYTVFGVGNYVLGQGDMGLVSYNESGNVIEDRNPDDEDSKYIELGLGLAYRPIYNDRLNLIAKYSYIYDTGSRTQTDRNYSEKAHIGSFEGIYDLTKKLSISAKYAIRREEVKLYLGDEWFENTLDFYGVRATYEVIKKWDLFAEYHWLHNRTDGDTKHGAIAGVYREINENLQFGVGYNFTEFTDDLTDLDYRSQGWFINLIGKF